MIVDTKLKGLVKTAKGYEYLKDVGILTHDEYKECIIRLRRVALKILDLKE